MDVEQAAAGDSETAAVPLTPTPTFEDVFRENAPFVWRCLRRLGISDADVDDLCQETFLVIHRKIAGYDPCRGTLRSWIYGICVRKASDHRKLARNRLEQTMDQVPELPIDAPQHGALERVQALSKLDRALSSIDEDKRNVFVLYEIEGLTLEEISQALGTPLQTIYSRLAGARKAITRALSIGCKTEGTT